jgi:hypothetical protein
MKVKVYKFETRKGEFYCTGNKKIKALNAMIKRCYFETDDIIDISFRYYEQT